MTRSNPLWNHAVLDVYVNMLVPSGALSCFELYYVLAIRSVVHIASLFFIVIVMFASMGGSLMVLLSRCLESETLWTERAIPTDGLSRWVSVAMLSHNVSDKESGFECRFRVRA